MRITVFGAGAIGGTIAALLAGTESEVAVVARGAHLAAIRERGLTLEAGDRTSTLRVTAVEDPAALGPQDLVIIAAKAHATAAAAPGIAKLLHRDTVLLPAQNGIPWWYSYRSGDALDGTLIAAADPGGRLREILDPARVIGCVVYMAAAVPEPGVVRQTGSSFLIIGEPDGTSSERLGRVAACLSRGGIRIETTSRIRDAIWTKLWGNVSFNPVSLLTGATMARMLEDPGVHALLRTAMREMQAVAERLGIRFEQDADARLDGARRLGHFKTSMLQDYEAGRPIEIEALVGSVIELGRRVGEATPILDALYALTRLRAPAA
jgi:2-dehydropantoate 2-reductase